MFTKPTVIIIGAGASVEFGLPSGEEVYKEFAKLCRQYVKNNFSIPDEYYSLIRAIIVLGLEDKLMSTLMLPAQRIDVQYNTSIDEYLYDNPSLYKIGKLFSTHVILRRYFNINNEVKAHKINTHLLNYVSSKEGSFKSWISTLVKNLTDGVETVEDLKKNKLTIVTFNYDTMIEEAIFSMLKSTEKFNSINNIDFLDILHVNGKFQLSSSYPNSQYRYHLHNDKHFFWNEEWNQTIAENSKRIFMIKEPVSNEVKIWRKTAKKAIEYADKIYSIGFACAQDNVELIGLPDAMLQISPPNFFALNFNGNINLEKKFETLGVQKSKINGTASSLMGCSRAAELGFFSQ